MIFHRIIPFLAINKLRRLTYLRTPSGNPKLKLWLSLLIPKLFSYPLGKTNVVDLTVTTILMWCYPLILIYVKTQTEITVIFHLRSE